MNKYGVFQVVENKGDKVDFVTQGFDGFYVELRYAFLGTSRFAYVELRYALRRTSIFFTRNFDIEARAKPGP